MSTRDHNNRSEKQKGHGHESRPPTASDRAGTDERHDGRCRNNGGGDGAGGAPKTQGQGQANKHASTHGQNRGHG